MSTLTKVFIVVLVVFSITFTTMTISIVAQTPHWRETALKYEEHARVADTSLRNEIAASAATTATLQDTINDHLEKIGQLENQLQTSAADAAQRRSDLAKAESEKSSAEAMNRGLLAQLQIAEAARSEYKKHRDEVEKRNLELERRNMDLNDRVNEQTAKITVLMEQKRHYEQQINVLQAALKKSGSDAAVSFESPSGTAMENVRALTPVAGGGVRGQVTDVNGNLVSISVGSADGVKKDMEFTIHRGDQYVGTLQIQNVAADQSAGKVVNLNSKLSPARGDQVMDAGRRGSAPR